MSAAFIMWARALVYRLVIALLKLLVRPSHPVCHRLTLLKLDRLGDAVLSLGAVKKLLSVFPEKETLLIVSSIAAPVYRAEFPAATLLVLPAFSERFWPDFVQIMARHAARLRAIKTDHLVILRHQPSDYLHAIAGLVQARQVHATEGGQLLERVCLLYPRGPRVPYPEQRLEGGCLELEAHRRVVQSVVNRPVALHEVLPVLDAGPAEGAATLLVCPLTGSAIRQYPPASLARAVALFLPSAPGMGVTFCLPPEADRSPWETAVHEAGIPSVTWVCPPDLTALLQAISGARLVLAPDSAPAHLTTAMNKPGVFLLGGGQFGMFAPWQRSPLQVWLHHPMDCYHCQWHCIHAEPLCVTHIPASAIAAALRDAYAASSFC